ncbi:hypothetical protein V6N13_002587 [Hibiscus sabdariffa]
MAASADASTDDGNHTVELIVLDDSEPAANGSSLASSSEEITPLLTQIERPKINIFSVSRSRRKPRELVIQVPETEISPVSLFLSWAWNGSRYSAQSIPLFETAFVRCTITLILSYLWLRRIGQPIFGATHPRKLLVLRAVVGYLSLLSFIYCIQRIPFSLAILLSFTTPIMASIMARIILHEKLKIAEIGGLACSFSGMLFIFQQMLTTQGGLHKTVEASHSSFGGSKHIYAALIGCISSITGGISYCLIKAAAKASDQPVATVLAFGILASPAAGICTFAFEEFVLPSLYSLSLMLALGILSFLAEVFLARGLQLEKISRAANVLFVEAALSQLWGIGTSSIAPSLGGLVGCLLILISVSFTMYFGPEKEME